jgi:uncharacterized protein YbjT (DUF2867 family)
MILVVGATGLLGGEITRRLLEQGKEVRILVRRDSPSAELAQQGRATDAESLIAAGAQPVYGDLKDRASLDTACAGISTIISTANSAVRWGDDHPQTVEMQGNRDLIAAAAAAGVNHFIFLSAQMADPGSPVPFLAGKAQAEEALRQSGMTYTILAPVAFMEIWVGMLVAMPAIQGQPVTLVGGGERKHSFISSGDVAAFAVAAVDNPRAANRKLVLGGPEPLSFMDAVAIYEEALGREIPVNHVAPGEPLPMVPEGAWGMVAAFDTYDSPIDMDETAAEFGVRLTSLFEVAQMIEVV